MVGEVADVVPVAEGGAEGGGVVGPSLLAPRRQGATGEVVPGNTEKLLEGCQVDGGGWT